MMPMAPSPCSFCMLPSFMLMSTTDDSRPPYRAGNPPLISSTFLMASALNTEKKPNKCEALYTGVPSSRIRFWSGEPPRTYRPLLPSPPPCTPGSSCSTFSTSVSPKSAGSSLI